MSVKLESREEAKCGQRSGKDGDMSSESKIFFLVKTEERKGKGLKE